MRTMTLVAAALILGLICLQGCSKEQPSAEQSPAEQSTAEQTQDSSLMTRQITNAQTLSSEVKAVTSSYQAEYGRSAGL